MTIVYLGFAWLIGIWLGAATEGPLWFWLLLGFASLILAIYFRKCKQRQLWLLIMAFICLGSGRYIFSQAKIDQDHIAFYNGRDEVIISGLVDEEPAVFDRYITLNLKAEEITNSDFVSQPVEGLVRVIAPRYPLIEYGTSLKISGLLESPANSAGGFQAEYLARKGILSQMMPTSIDVLAEGQGNLFRHTILDIKSRARETIQKMLPDPKAALLTGILLGDDSGLPADLEEEFRLTSLTHIIAISGLNGMMLRKEAVSRHQHCDH